MIRVALYARYSSDQQRGASIEDQLRLCRLYAEKQSWAVADSYHDRAASGASLIRPGIQALLADALRGRFEVVLAEALDRISRDQEDVAGVFKRMAFADVKIITLSEGEITHLHVGLKGTMNALFLKDLADKTRRGLRGRVEAGKAGGGLCYGYWGDTTIRGHACRGNGVLNNELYIGRLVWNRQRFVKDPSTGRRVSRRNSEADWIKSEVPELRLVDDVLWQAVKARQVELAKVFEATTIGVREARAKRLNGTRRHVFLLSGLLSCGCCKGKYGIISKDRYGCLNHYRRGSCSNRRTIQRAVIEERVLAGLTERLVSADAVAEAVRAHHEEMNRQNHARRAQTEADRKALAKVKRGIAGIMAAIEDGMYEPTMKARIEELQRQKAEIEGRLNAAAPEPLDVNRNIAELYGREVQRLTDALTDTQTHQEAAAALRSLISDVVLTPGEVNARLRGELMGILDCANGGNAPRTIVVTKGAASPRNHRYRNRVLAWFAH